MLDLDALDKVLEDLSHTAFLANAPIGPAVVKQISAALRAAVKMAEHLEPRHTKFADGDCVSCGAHWPCPDARNAAEFRKAMNDG